VKRVAFGFTNFENFRIRALLYAGKPNFRVLDSIVVTVSWLTPQMPEEPHAGRALFSRPFPPLIPG